MQMLADSRGAIRRFSPPAVLVALAASLGASVGIATAQDRPPGQLNTVCAADCAVRGYDPEFCGQVCWIPDPEMAARAVPVDWICMTECLDRGGKLIDCKLRCGRR